MPLAFDTFVTLEMDFIMRILESSLQNDTARCKAVKPAICRYVSQERVVDHNAKHCEIEMSSRTKVGR